MGRSSEKNSDLRPQLDSGRGRSGVKGQDERQSSAPLTPLPPLRGVLHKNRLTGPDAVIHGECQFLPGGYLKAEAIRSTTDSLCAGERWL